MSVIDRLGQVVKSEWTARFGSSREGREDEGNDKPSKADHDDVDAALKRPAPSGSSTAHRPTRSPAVTDVDGALRVLELTGAPNQTPGLDEVRARYRELARRYHPKTQSDRPDDQSAAHVVLEALTDALEVLEEHLLPLPPSSSSSSSPSSK